MIGQDYIPGPCDTCKDSGKHPTKRKMPCPDCEGRGYGLYCSGCKTLSPCPDATKALDGTCEHPTNNILVMRVEPDGTRKKVLMADLHVGDQIHMVGQMQVDWRTVWMVDEEPKLLESGTWSIQGHPVKNLPISVPGDEAEKST